MFIAPETGVVVICGGPAWEGINPPDVSDKLRQALANGCVIGGICGGTVALARAGLLDDVAHTSNASGYLISLVPGYQGSSKYVTRPSALRDGNIITAPAPAPGTFATEVLTAAGLEKEAAGQIEYLLSQEHRGRET
jgi:putative intracellular protease/amidase